MSFNIKKLAAALAVSSAGMLPCIANAVPVGLELLLLVDVSGTIDDAEYRLQKTGYIDAFNSASVQAAILGSQGGAIAVSYTEWSGIGQLRQLVGWRIINSAQSAGAFADSIAASSRAYTGINNTALQYAIKGAYGWFGSEVGATVANGFESGRQVIDVSGDGRNNIGLENSSFGRDEALNAGVDTVNGIYIVGEPGLAEHYNNFVKGGVNSFIEEADDFVDFSAAIERKLIREISNTPVSNTPVNQVPEPYSAALVGLGLIGMTLARRTHRASRKN